jgi:hypothetical protein
MTESEELKIRAQAESAALNSILSLLLGNFVVQAGSAAVSDAKLKEAIKPDAGSDSPT